MIKRAKLIRLSEFKGATFGQLVIDDFPFFSVLELPWEDNQRDISCIPNGDYICKYREDVTLRNGHVVDATYEITEVHKRGGIYFHVGNYPRNTLGCPLLGTSFGMNGDTPCVWESQKAFDKFMVMSEKVDAFKLAIVSAF